VTKGDDRRSETTLSSFEEVHTPSPNGDEFTAFNFEGHIGKRSIEGPRGPHLFRSSIESYGTPQRYEEDDVLGMSPMTPRASNIQTAPWNAPKVPEIPLQHRPIFSHQNDYVDPRQVAFWSPQDVANHMYDAGFEVAIVEKFEENDISGAILMTLKFEDLRELDIPSFGARTRIWNEIHILRGSAPSTPKPSTPIEEVASPVVEASVDFTRPSRGTSRGHSKRDKSSRRGESSRRRDESQGCKSGDELHRRKSSRRRHRKNDVVTPMESISIVGIEQLMPKPHKCAKGENCSKWRKQQRLISNFNKDHPVSPEGGYIWVAGDPGNAATADAIADGMRPVSDAVPSVVASSDVLGPAIPQFRHLEEATLRNVQLRDPQDNVKQFLQFQHMEPVQQEWSEEPITPPYEMFPTLPQPHGNLRTLPKLSIPPPRAIFQVPPPRTSSSNANPATFEPYQMERVEAKSPELRNATQSPTNTVYRFGTPFSEMDVPVTAVPIGPVARDVTQSVPPNMSYRTGNTPIIARSQSRSSARRPSFAAMPRVDEYLATYNNQTGPRHHHHSISQSSIMSPQNLRQPPLSSQAIATPVTATRVTSISPTKSPTVDDVTHAGPMKKRKTKLLRHEWHEHHFTLKGTRLAMHKDASALETLEYIDVDDYAIACSSLASGSKLNAAFKAMSISRTKNNAWDGPQSASSKKLDDAAFAFQLIPAAIEKGQKLRKERQSVAAPGEGKDVGKGTKTHYFAVKSRDERIDWMRELMLAKALRQKAEGFEVKVNGNMI